MEAVTLDPTPVEPRMVSEDLDSVTFSSNQSEDNGGSVLGNRSWRRKIMDNLPSALKVRFLLPQCLSVK